jgi:hypothetical protein
MRGPVPSIASSPASSEQPEAPDDPGDRSDQSARRHSGGSVLIELGPDGYVVLGSDRAVAYTEALAVLRDLMADGETRTEKQMRDALPDVKRTSLQSARDGLIEEDVLERLSRDRRSDPYRYRPVVCCRT